MTPGEAIFSALTALGGLAGLSAILLWRHQARKIAAEARKLDVDADVAADAGEDAHWQAIIAAQAEAIIAPLRTEVEELRVEVRKLRDEVETHRTRYWRAITYIRTLLAWSRHPSTSDVPPPPAELAVDI